jgi:LAO/AO transport system kinase
MMLDFTPGRAWRPPIIQTVAPRGEGVAEVVAALASHGEHLAASAEGDLRHARRARARLLTILEDRFRRAVESRAPEPDGLEEAVRALQARRSDPYTAAGRLFDRLVRSMP